MHTSALRTLTSALLVLAPLPRSQTPPNILEQYAQDGQRTYLVVNVGFTNDSCSEGATGTAIPPVTEGSILVNTVIPALEHELESISHAVTPFQVTIDFEEIQVDHSPMYYKSFHLEAPGCNAYSNETRPMVELRHDARAELAAVNLESYDRIIYIAERFAWSKGNGGQGTINQRETLIDLTYLSGSSDQWHHIIIHELGHSFMFQHANVYLPTCSTSSGRLGLEIRYADKLDPMGTGEGHWFNPWFMQRVGWLSPTSVLDVEDLSVPYEIQPIEQAPSLNVPTALRVRLDANTNAWIFWRKYAGGEHLDGAMITLESESPISRSLLIKTVEVEECPIEFPPPLPSLVDAPLGVMETFPLNLPGVEPGQPWKTTGITVANMGVTGDKMTIAFTGPGVFPAGTNPVIGRLYPEPTSGSISGQFTYEFSAYRPEAGSSNGSGIASVQFRLFEWVDNVRGAAFGLAHCPIGPAATPPDPPYPAPQLPRHPTSLFCGGELATPRAGEPAAPTLQPPYTWTFDTTTVPNGCYWLFVQATGENGAKTVIYWPHIIYNQP